jgi:hypothetical protein
MNEPSLEPTFSSPIVKAVFDYWLDLKGDRPAPERSEIDPIRIPRLTLPYLLLVELTDKPFRVKYRLVGTYCVEIFGMDYTGLFLDELGVSKDIAEQLHKDYVYVATTCLPIVERYKWLLLDGDQAIAEYAILPLLQDGAVRRCLAVEHLTHSRRVYADELVATKSL